MNDNPTHAPAGIAEPPLYVDLDGTLTHSDLLLESLLALMRNNPLSLLLLPDWLTKGKGYLKAEVACRVEIDAGQLPYNLPFVDYLRAEHARGRRLVLATASTRSYAERVARHLGIFDDVIASSDHENLSGAAKCRAILDHNGGAPFDYAGNALRDVAIWERAHAAVVVNASDRTLAAASRVTRIHRVFDKPEVSMEDYARALRAHQWLKNLLLFVPLLTAHQWSSSASLGALVFAFLAFSLCASGVYLFNDLTDLPADRQHPRKRMRPFAAGRVPPLHGLALIPVALLGAGLLSLPLPRDFFLTLLAYFALSTAYSLGLKRIALVDVLTLATLYALRVIAGAAAIDVPLSFWLLAFSVFLFFSLALLKRCAELGPLPGSQPAAGRGYQGGDVAYLRIMGISSGYLAVLVFALFINSPEITDRYNDPRLLWLSCPPLLYWVTHLWVSEGRGRMHDDPLIFALRDVPSHAVLWTMVAMVFIAR
jgi:4-hydroxybenzoate polyprenyltransferase